LLGQLCCLQTVMILGDVTKLVDVEGVYLFSLCRDNLCQAVSRGQPGKGYIYTCDARMQEQESIIAHQDSSILHHRSLTTKAVDSSRQTDSPRTESNEVSTTTAHFKMKLALATGLLMAATSINAQYSCGKGAKVIIFVMVAGRAVQAVTCENLPGVFETKYLPKNDNDAAQIYLAQVRKEIECGENSGCNVLFSVPLLGDPFEALETLGCEQKTECEAAGGTYLTQAL
jgi:hypothetical protein